MACLEHFRVLLAGQEAWEQWLERSPGILPDLSGADLRGVDLSDARLCGVNFRGANLEGADLRRADLRGVNLRGANLLGAALEGADLHSALLEGAQGLSGEVSVSVDVDPEGFLAVANSSLNGDGIERPFQ